MGEERRNRREFMRLTMKRYNKLLSKLEKRSEDCDKHEWRYKILGEHHGWVCQKCDKEVINE